MLKRLTRSRSLIISLALALLGVGCAHSNASRFCTPQNAEVLTEIIEGKLDACAPATALWEREHARNCGWILPEDFHVEKP